MSLHTNAIKACVNFHVACIFYPVYFNCAKNRPAVKKGEAKNAQVHVHEVTKRHDIKIWPRKHLQYRHFCTFIFYMLYIITSN